MTDNTGGGHFLLQSTSDITIFIPEDFSKEHKAIGKSVKEFVAGEIQSRGDEIEHVNNELSRELMRSAGEIGLLAADVPDENLFAVLEMDGTFHGNPLRPPRSRGLEPSVSL